MYFVTPPLNTTEACPRVHTARVPLLQKLSRTFLTVPASHTKQLPLALEKTKRGCVTRRCPSAPATRSTALGWVLQVVAVVQLVVQLVEDPVEDTTAQAMKEAGSLVALFFCLCSV